MTQACPSAPFSIIIPALGSTVRSVFVHEQISNLLLSAELSKDREFKPLFVVAFFCLALGIEPQYSYKLGKALPLNSNPIFDGELGIDP